MKNYTCLFLILVFLSSCNMAKHYANYRKGGKTKRIAESVSQRNNNSPAEIALAETEIEPKIFPVSNADSFSLAIKPDRELSNKEMLIEENYSIKNKSSSREKLQQINSPDTNQTKAADTLYPDEALVNAISGASMNCIAGIFGLLTLVEPGFIWFAAPMYLIGVPFCTLITLIAIVVALVQYQNGTIGKGNKKYFFIWLLLFVVSSLVIAGTLIAFL